MKDKFKLVGSLESIKKEEEEDGKYGHVEYADKKNKKYPIDTEEHVRAAWSYIHQKRNAAKYTPEELKEIKSNIAAAAKRYGIHIKDASVEDMDDGGGDMGEPGDVGDTDGALLDQPQAQLFFDDDAEDDTAEAADKMFAVMDAESELRHEMAEIDESYTDVDLINEETQSLEAIRDSVEAYGICRATMEASDPKHKLVEQGLCCSYEELSNVPMKDEISEMVVCNLNDTIQGLTKLSEDQLTAVREKESNFLTKITTYGSIEGFTDRIKSWLVHQVVRTRNADESIKKLKSDFSEVNADDTLEKYLSVFKQKMNSFDDNKFKNDIVNNTYSKPRFRAVESDLSKLIPIGESLKLISIGQKLIKISEAQDPDMTEFDKCVVEVVDYFKPHHDLLHTRFGIFGCDEIDNPVRGTNTHMIQHHGDYLPDDKIKIGSTWSKSDLVSAITDAKKLLDKASGLEFAVDQLSHFDEKLASLLNGRKTMYDKCSREEAANHARIINVTYDLIHNEYLLLEVSIKTIDDLVESVLKLSRACYKSKTE